MQATVQHSQVLIDIAMQELGTADAFDLALKLDKSLTDDLFTGEQLEVNTVGVAAAQKKVSIILKRKENLPASGDTPINGQNPKRGIGYWRIGQDFIVS